MKIGYITGCTCDSLTIDGKESINIKVEDLQATIKKVVDKETDVGILQNILMDLMYHLGEPKDLGHCEECGDYIEQFTLEV